MYEAPIAYILNGLAAAAATSPAQPSDDLPPVELD